jgi:hypothetical protein
MSQFYNSRLTDPLAQTFFVKEQYGVFVTKVDLYFAVKPTTDSTLISAGTGVQSSVQSPIYVEIRPASGGRPSTSGILENSVVTLNNSDINVSTDASVATTFTFEEPVFLSGRNSYAICIRTNDINLYQIYTSKLGDFVLGTNTQRVRTGLDTGEMYHSSNGLTYEGNQDADIKFKLYRANFAVDEARARFNSAQPDLELLGSNPLKCDSGSGGSTITVSLPNHGFQVNDKVNIQGGLTHATTYNGFKGSALMGQHTITAVDGFGFNFAADSGTAVDSGSFGGSTITSTVQYQFEIAQLHMDHLNAANGLIDHRARFTTSKSFASSTQQAYDSSEVLTMELGVDLDFDKPMVILTDSNEATHFGGDESLEVDVFMFRRSDNTEVAPTVDLQRTSMFTIGNIIDRQDSAATTNFNVPISFVNETDATDGTSLAKHITKPVILENPATGLKILLGANRPEECDINVFYRTVQSGSDSDIRQVDFVAVEPDTEMPSDTNPNIFRQYEYTIGGEFFRTLPSFDKYQVKVQMGSHNSAKVPRITDLRTIALGDDSA